MSGDKHSADGAHTQACVTQQEVPLLPLAAVSMSDCTSPTRSSLPGLIRPRISAMFFFFYPLDSFTKFKTNQKKLYWHNFSSNLQFEFGCDMKNRSCPSKTVAALFSAWWKAAATLATAQHKNWQRSGNTTTSVRAINAGEWASGHIVN